MEYAVHIELERGGARAFTEDEAEQLAEIGGGASYSPDRIGTTMTVDAAGPAQAATKALRQVDKILGRGEPVAVEILTVDEQDRVLAGPAFPELAGITEIADMLGVTRQRASSLQKLHAFPAPVAHLASGPVWRKGDLSRFAETWERKPGRPPKAPASRVG